MNHYSKIKEIINKVKWEIKKNSAAKFHRTIFSNTIFREIYLFLYGQLGLLPLPQPLPLPLPLPLPRPQQLPLP
jgi:hypothetical protein